MGTINGKISFAKVKSWWVTFDTDPENIGKGKIVKITNDRPNVVNDRTIEFVRLSDVRPLIELIEKYLNNENEITAIDVLSFRLSLWREVLKEV